MTPNATMVTAGKGNEGVTHGVPGEAHGSTARTRQLREGLYWKAPVVKEWVNIAMGLAKCTFRRGVRVDMDRARLLTASYKQTDGQPWVIRRAKAVAAILEGMPVTIKPGELIVGDANGAANEIRWYPEATVHWASEAVTTGGFSGMVTSEERREIVDEICAYWNDRCMLARLEAAMPQELAPYFDWRADLKPMVYDISDVGKSVPSYDFKVLYKEGLQARLERIEAKLRDLDAKACELNPAEYLEKKSDWTAMAICGRAILRFAQRHAEVARQQAAAEAHETRRRELEDIAAILERVPALPPRTFHEALQFYWTVEVAGRFLAVFGLSNGIRLDQIWWPYYAADLEAGRITPEQALELIECLFLKIQETGYPLDWPGGFAGRTGAELFYTANICGTTPDGRDASNDLSYLIMDALASLHVNQPPIALRYHHNISPEVVDRAIDLLRTGMGHPAFFSEELMEKWALMRGWSPKEAKNVTVSGCVVHQINGKYGFMGGYKQMACLNLPKLLEEVLFQRDVPGPLSWMETPKDRDPRELSSADEILDCFLERLLLYVRVGTVLWNIGKQVQTHYWPDPCNSFLFDEPVERGRDLTKVQTECDAWPMIDLFGRINVADSLAAVHKLVFAEQRYTMGELVDALSTNWVGHEEMRQEFLNAPKYGNDDDCADDWARKVSVAVENTVNQVKDAWGHPVSCSGSVAVAYDLLGFGTAATPDGRRAGDPLDDGTRSPMPGADTQGPTAVLNSAGKIPYLHPELLNQKFLPQALDGENKRLFAEYLREWHDKGTIPHIQFNVIDNAMLREAQAHPERHLNLQVRVAGYSAFFVDLSKEMQDTIIARTAQGLC
jgi:pyruvate formate-lyase/glycerol dehydratase family glycyl radical enzyme